MAGQTVRFLKELVTKPLEGGRPSSCEVTFMSEPIGDGGRLSLRCLTCRDKVLLSVTRPRETNAEER